MHRRLGAGLLGLAACGLLGTWGSSGCSGGEVAHPGSGDDGESPVRFHADDLFEADLETVRLRPPANPERNVYFGDLHVHTAYSFDAFVFGTLATPSDAYRYARGEKLRHPGGFDVQLREPLDFYAVTDHAMFLGAVREAADTTTELSRFDFSEPLHDINAPDNYGIFSLPGRVQAFSGFLPAIASAVRDGRVDRELVFGIARSAWRDTAQAADLWNEPGRFTTFAAYEYTSSTDDRGNLHRNVIFRDTVELPDIPFSRFHSQNPEGLWDWMDGLRERGVESLAIPHNSNGSNGSMFELVDWADAPIDADYAARRIRNEPLVEITQVKGTSETHPLLSETDEWAGFEIMPYRVATMLPSDPPGSYVRDALRRGLSLEQQTGINPYDFGIVGASDTHTGAISDDEANFFSKLGILDSTAELRGSVPMGFIQATLTRWAAPTLVGEIEGQGYTHSATPTYGASGLTGVWAEENTREAIYDAFRRKETFATSGPRIRLRFFGGADLADGLADDPKMIALADEAGVAMGGELVPAPGSAPRFLVWATRDPASAPLQRLQIIKGWIEDGETFEVVHDVACSEGNAVDPETSRCPDNGAKVDLDDCSISADVGAGELRALWSDPAFDSSQRAFYYVRVLENPTCRWSTWDALRSGVEPRPDLPKTIQERAWSSPIQVVPAS